MLHLLPLNALWFNLTATLIVVAVGYGGIEIAYQAHRRRQRRRPRRIARYFSVWGPQAGPSRLHLRLLTRLGEDRPQGLLTPRDP